MLKIDFYHLANTSTNTDDILKMVFCYTTSILTNTKDKANDIIKEMSVASN